MEMRRLLVVLLTMAVAFGALVANAERAVAQTVPQGAFVDEVIFFEQPNAAIALEQVSRGVDMQIYMFNLRTLADKLAALNDPNIWTVQTPGSVNDLWLNPVPNAANVSGFNPFQLVAVRRAMNYLVDRQFIINEIYGGFGLPYVAPWHAKMPEYRRDAPFFQTLDTDFTFNAARAKTEITAALLGVPGMTQDSTGKFFYNSAPLTVRFVIRTEDIRLDIGNYVANQLEGIGITVIRDYSLAGAAFAKVYNGPPDRGFWNLYTEGFAFTALVAWQDSWIADFYTRDSGETVWDFYTAPAALEAAAFALRDGQYADLAARTALIQDASRRAVEDGVRVWMVAENAVFIYNRRITAAVNDLMAGPWGFYTTRSARYGTEGGTLLVGQPVHWNSQWNSFRGFTWLYDATQQRALTDVGIYLHPTTGFAADFRAHATVVTAGPSGDMPIPTGAFIYNNNNTTGGQFVPVPAGSTATSKITYDYTFAPWHDGSPMSMDDLWYTIASYHRRIGGADAPRDPYNRTGVPVGTNPATMWPSRYAGGDIGKLDPRADGPGPNFWLGLFKGARQVDADTLEIYADYWHFDQDFIGLNIDIFPALPWHAQELQTKAVLDNEARFDAGQAQTDSKTTIDVIRGATLTLMNADLLTLRTAGHRPPAMAGSPAVPNDPSTAIDAAEASARWTAINQWRTDHNNYYVSNGPFYLDVANVPVKQTVMKRFASYPFPADYWDKFIAPAIPVVAIGTIPRIVPGEAATIPVTTTLSGVGSNVGTVTYLIRDVGQEQTVFVGQATAGSTAGSWAIALDRNTTGRFVPGAHEITATVTVGELGIPVGTARSFIVIPQTVFVEEQIEAVRAELDDLTQQLTTTNQQLAAANAQIASLNTLLTVAVIVAVIAVVVSSVGVVLALRRGMSPGSKGPPVEKTGEEL